MSCLQILQFCISGTFNTYTFNKLSWIMNKATYKALIKSATWKLLNTLCPNDFCGKLRFLLEETPKVCNITGQKLLSKMTKGKRDLDENSSNMLPIQKAQLWKQKADSHLPKTSSLRQWQFPLLTFVPWEIWGDGVKEIILHWPQPTFPDYNLINNCLLKSKLLSCPIMKHL